jgi:hypothetical protein
MPVAFDTHQLITRLTHGQMTLEQAEAVSAALQEALESSIGTLATTQDLDALRTGITQEFTHLKWVLGVNMTLVVLVLGKLLLFMKP